MKIMPCTPVCALFKKEKERKQCLFVKYCTEKNVSPDLVFFSVFFFFLLASHDWSLSVIIVLSAF